MPPARTKSRKSKKQPNPVETTAIQADSTPLGATPAGSSVATRPQSDSIDTALQLQEPADASASVPGSKEADSALSGFSEPGLLLPDVAGVATPQPEFEGIEATLHEADGGEAAVLNPAAAARNPAAAAANQAEPAPLSGTSAVSPVAQPQSDSGDPASQLQPAEASKSIPSPKEAASALPGFSVLGSPLLGTAAAEVAAPQPKVEGIEARFPAKDVGEAAELAPPAAAVRDPATASKPDLLPDPMAEALPPIKVKPFSYSRRRTGERWKNLGKDLLRDIRKQGLQTVASILVIGFLILLAVAILQYFIGFEEAKKSVAAFIKGDWAVIEMLGELMQQERNPTYFKLTTSLKEGPRYIVGTSIRINFHLGPEEGGVEPRKFRIMEVSHEGPLQDTSLISLRDVVIVSYRTKTAHDDHETNCGVMVEWFVPRMTTPSTDHRGDSLVMIIAIRNISPTSPPCPALSGER